ncbi:cadherin-like beta sandwich domain-containing protein [Paenibacillus sp. HWE-109]|uniref:cadherin-like beta sandwich domain-containing protein n=1 Tax=Paenibacillus sp. HWE-109 TaxID=1306526 RepID=UPI001EE088F2|nr:cadherin-like beta sandwich domain-containing protein [Paenibacillus sp. HWE-109]UKS25434.1 cadherin-like beta sandwich domain-containing protein [Paenibacillus sp. HWE-109]
MVHWRDVSSIFRGNRFYARAALLGLLLLVAAGIGAVSVASAATFTVNTTADTVDSNTGDGVCADSNSQCSLRAAIMQANALPGADVITIPTGTYTTASAQLEIRGDVTLQGSNSASTIIQAGLNAAASTHRVLEINPDLDNTGYNVTIQGLTIRYGNSTPLSNYGGGGIGGDVGSKTLTITDSIIANNTTAEDGFGGGMYISGTSAGKVKLTNVTITDNTAGAANSANYSSRGGGMYLEGDMALEMSNLTVQNNMSYGLGGGVAIVSASNALRNVTIDSSTFSSNKAFSKNGGTEGRAGGLYLGSPAVITNTAFTGNTAGSDGGGLVLDFFAGTVSLTDVEGTGNSAVRGGGMFINANKAPVLTRTNFTGNNSGGNIAVNSEGTDMIVKMAPNGTFSQGKTGAHYTVTVTNNGNVKTNGTVTAVVALPTGLTASVLAGSGWTCTLATLTCFRSDVLNGKNNYPVIDVTVDVAANTPRSVTSSVSVSGGDELDVYNNTDTHNTIVLSKDATLTGLTLSNAALKETFAPETIAYTVDVLYAVNSLKVTPIVNEPHATVKVNNTLVTSGQASGSIPLSVGSSNVITVTVTAENSDTKSYTITVNRAPQSSDATLKDLTVDGTTVTDFVPGTVSYTVKVPNEKTAVTVLGTKTDAMAGTPVVVGGSNLAVGNNTVTITVTAENGITKVYTVTVVRAPSSNANLIGLNVDGAPLADFASGTLAYTFNVLYAKSAIAITGIKEDATANAVVAGGSILAVGNNTVTVTVTAEDGTTKKIYTVTVVRADKSTNANLTDLKVDGVSVGGFSSSRLNYTVDVPNTKTSVVVMGTKEDSTAGNPVVVGGSNLLVGDNTVTVTVTAEDGTTKKVYTVTIVRAANSDASLSALEVDGTSVANFDPNTLTYTVNVPNATQSVVVTGTKKETTASDPVVVGGSNLLVGNNTVTVTVTAEDGTTKKIYTVIVVRAASSDASLSDLKVDGTSVANFDPLDLAYTLNVPNSQTSVVVVTTTTDPTALTPVVVGGSNLLVGNNTVTITVTAEDGTTKKVYTLTIVRAASNDAALIGLSVDGTPLTGFASDTFTYTYNVLYAKTSINITGTKAYANASVAVAGGSNLIVGNNTVTVTVTAEDGVTKQDYTVTVVRADKSTNANLKDLSVDGVSLTDFAPAKVTYKVNVPNTTTSVVVVGTKEDLAAVNPVVVGGSNLLVGDNTVTVTVTAEDGTTKKEYTVTVVRAASNDASLIDLKVDGTSVANFDPNTLAYTVNVPNATKLVVVTGTKKETTASDPVVVGGSNLLVGNNTVTVTVTAEDGTTKKIYTVTVVRAASSDASLSDLKVDGTSVANFDPLNLAYTVNVPNTQTSVVVVTTTTDPTALTPIVVGGSNLLVGNNTVTVTVKAEDGTTKKVYTLTVVRAASNDASLSGLSVDGTPIVGFASGQFNYTVNVSNATSSVSVTGKQTDPTATVNVEGGSNLKVGSNTVTITVTAQNLDIQKYTVTVIRSNKSANAKLSDIQIDGVSLTGFLPRKTTYTFNVPNATTSVVVTGMLEDPLAAVAIAGGTDLAVGYNNVTLTVTAEDGTTVISYTVNIVRAGDSNMSLSSLLLNGESVPGFSQGKFSYAVTVTHEVYSVTVSGSVYAPTSQILINNVVGASKVITLQDGLNAVVVKVIAQNLSEQVYSIAITRNTSAELNGFSLSGVTLTPVFAPKTLGYSGTVPNTVQSTTVSASVYDPLASIAVYHNNVLINSVNAPIQLIEGRNTISIVVTPQIGDLQTYTAVITREGQPSSSGSGGGGPSDPTQVLFRIGDNGTELPIHLERKHAADGRVIDTVAITPEIVQLAGSSGSKGNVLKLKIPQIPEGSDEFNIGFTQEALQALNKGGTAISIEMEAVQMTIPLHTVAKALESKEELLIRFIPISSDAAKQQIQKRVMTAVLVTKAAGSGQVAIVGLPLTIESNITNNEVTLNFSFKGIQIPTDPKKRNEFLASLGIYIEHSDGEKELVKGKINYDTQGNPVSMEIIITKFSTFSMIEIQKKPIDTISYTSWIEGYPDGTFKPNQSITRAEVSSIFVKAIAKPQSLVALQNFKDVADQHWAADAIHQAQKAEWLSGYPDGSFKPDAPITRGELAAIIVKINKLAVNNDVQAFVDTKNHWAAGYIQAAKASGLMSGYEDGSFRPDQPLTRAEAVKVINNLLKRPTPKLGKDVWKDVSQKDWFWSDVQSASESFSQTQYVDGTSSSIVLP